MTQFCAYAAYPVVVSGSSACKKGETGHVVSFKILLSLFLETDEK